MSSVRSAALGFFVGAGSRGERTEEAGLSHFLEHMLFRGTERYASAEIDQLFDGMGAELNAGTDKEAHDGLRADARPASAARVRRDGRHGLAPGVQRRRPRARGRARGDRDVRGRPAGHGLRRARRRGLRRPPAGPPDHRPRAGDPRHAGRPTSPPSTPAATCRPRSSSRRPAPSITTSSWSWRSGRWPACAPARRPRCPTRRRRARARACASRPRRPSRSTSASAAPGLPRHDDRRHALRVLDAIFGGLTLVAAVPERARGARPGLRRLLVLRPVHRHGPDRPLRRHAAGQGGGGDGRRPRRARADARAARDRGRARRVPARTSRRASCSRSSRPPRG